MTELDRPDFEHRFEVRLARYAAIDVAPVDGAAVARSVMRHRRRATVSRYLLVAAVVTLGGAAVAGMALFGGRRPESVPMPSRIAEVPPSTQPSGPPSPSPSPSAVLDPVWLAQFKEPLLGYEISVPAPWVEARNGTLQQPPAPGVRRYGPVTVSIGTPDGAITLCDPSCRSVTGATSTRALERSAGEDAGLTTSFWAVSDLDGEPGAQIRVRLPVPAYDRVVRQLAIHEGRPVVVDFDLSDGRATEELRARILATFHFLAGRPMTTDFVAPDGSYAIALTERWKRSSDRDGAMVFRDPGQLVTIAAADPDGRVATCLDSVGAWETCGQVVVSSLEELDAAIKPERISEHGAGAPIVARDVTSMGGEPAVAYSVQSYEYPAHGAQWVTYVATMHGGRAYILRIWTGMQSGIVSLDELLAGFRFLDSGG
jgi:hypothetical protein